MSLCPHCGKGIAVKFQVVAALDVMEPDAALVRDHAANGEPSIERIVDVVCEDFKLAKALFYSRKRPEFISTPRMAAMYLARRLTGHSLESIGQAMAKDHGTIWNGCQATAARMETNGLYRARIERLEARLKKEAA